MGAEVPGEGGRQRKTEVLTEMRRDGNTPTQGDRGERQTERQMLQDRNAGKGPRGVGVSTEL